LCEKPLKNKSTFAYKQAAMVGNDNNRQQALQDALGKPKYFIDTPGKKEGEQYFWFPTLGSSMTDRTAQSIPSGSMVLGRLLVLNSVEDIPLHQPIVVIIDDGGQQYCMLKIACDIKVSDMPDANLFCLRSYNPGPGFEDFWLPFSCLKFIFKVERVRLPNGNEFVPKRPGDL
jgi:hypothetical protein